MDDDIEELYFQKLQELVQDEDKIVTVASLASDLGISIKISQKLMKKYVEDQRKLNSNDLAITYVLTGLLKDKRGRGVFMIKEEDLDTKQLLFEDKPFKLIYSVQKNKNVDFNIIALVDMFDAAKIREKALEGAIVSKNCIKRKLKVQQPPPPLKKSVVQPKPGTSTEENKPVEKHPESSKKTQKSKSGNIANLFKAVASKSNQKNGEKNSVTKSTVHSSKNGGKKSGGLSGFLISGATKSPKNVNTVQVKKEPVLDKKGSSSSNEAQDEIKQEEIMEIFDDDFEEQVQKTIDKSGTTKSLKNVNAIETKKEPVCDKKGSSSSNEVKDEIKQEEIMEVFEDDFEDQVQKISNKKDNTVKKANVERKKSNKKRQRDKSQERPSKRRKRIVERNDSDSDDLFEKEEDNEDIIGKSDDEPERIPSPVKDKPLPPKNKKRKAVTKTYTDEEGFVVTKTEYVYETASEDENEAPKPPKQEKQEKLEKPKPKVNDKKKPPKNQSTLMNFFKKV